MEFAKDFSRESELNITKSAESFQNLFLISVSKTVVIIISLMQIEI